MADITVRGAGIFGLSIAWAVVQRGASVKMIDPAGPGSGASGGIVGALAPHVPENWNPKKAFQLDSLLMAERFWQQVAEAGGQNPGYCRSGRLQPIADASALDLANVRAKNALTLWQGKALWEICEATGQAWEPPSPSGYLIRDTLSAHLHPKQACNALVAALRAQGVEIRREGDAQGPTVWATGVAGLLQLNDLNARTVGMGIKGQAALFDHNARGMPQLFADGLHIIPHGDGTVAVGSTTEREYDRPDITDALLGDVIARARTAVPALRDARVITRWAGLRPRSRSRAPMLGPWPERPGHYIANGGFKIGFGMAPKVAEVIAELLLEDRDNIPQGFRVEDSF